MIIKVFTNYVMNIKNFFRVDMDQPGVRYIVLQSVVYEVAVFCHSFDDDTMI